MKIIVDTDTHIPTKRAEFEFNGKKMCVAVSFDRYGYRYNNLDMHEQANYELHRAIEGFLRGQINDVLVDARRALGM
jgi:uncharacterized membrane protein